VNKPCPYCNGKRGYGFDIQDWIPCPQCEGTGQMQEDDLKYTRVFEYHKFFLEHKIMKATFEFEDGEAADYSRESDTEFQLSRVGDCATFYKMS